MTTGHKPVQHITINLIEQIMDFELQIYSQIPECKALSQTDMVQVLGIETIIGISLCLNPKIFRIIQQSYAVAT
jgi:hypothetical protein